MLNVEVLQEKVNGLLNKCDALEKQIMRLEDEAAAIEPEQASELARITLFHHHQIIGPVEVSRRHWKWAACGLGMALSLTWMGIVLSVCL